MLRLVTKNLSRSATSNDSVLSWLSIQRNFFAAASMRTRSADGGDHEDEDHHHHLRPEVLLSEENRQRVLERMQHAPSIGIKLPQSKHEAFYAAVLICLCTDGQGDVSLLYTLRSRQLRRHTRQISFPGGIKDPTDADFVDCALRETEEEIGLPRSRVQVWGTGKLIKPPHTAAIMPVVGTVNNLNLNELNINEDEVEEVFLIPIRRLLHADSLRHTQFKAGYSSAAFVMGPYRVWGVTGFITNSFLNCLIPVEVKRLKHHIKYIRPYRHKLDKD